MPAGHDHGSANPQAKDTRYLSAALAPLLAFMAAEVVVGIIASSLALISDAAHMLTDAAALALALLLPGWRLAPRQATILVEPDADCHERCLAIAALLAERYGINHTALQVDHPAQQPVLPAEQLSRRSST